MGVSKVRCSRCKQYVYREDIYLTLPVGRYCSAECVLAERTARRFAKKPRKKKPAPPGQEDYHVVIRRRDGHCRGCGRPGTQVHHITFRSQGGTDDPSNLILLCHRCHFDLAHGTEARSYRELFRTYVVVLQDEGLKLSIAEIQARPTANTDF